MIAYKVKNRLITAQLIDAGIRNFAALGIYAYLAEFHRDTLTLEDLDKFSDWESTDHINDALEDLVRADLIEEIEGGAA